MTSQFWARMPSFQKPDEAFIPKNSALVPALIDLYLFFFQVSTQMRPHIFYDLMLTPA